MILNAGWGDDGAQTNIKTLGPAPFITTNLAFSSHLFYHTWWGWKLPYVPHSNNRLTFHFAGLVNPIIAA